MRLFQKGEAEKSETKVEEGRLKKLPTFDKEVNVGSGNDV
jgi:hypothetical protein